ncbi:hypothetical protein MBLNU459_g0775t1 [Dothideomycetes sp. NU459]
MADFVRGLFGAASASVASAVPSADSDFADYAAAPPPSPASLSSTAAAPPAAQTFGAKIDLAGRPFTKWYNVHERVTWADFKAEAIILPILLLIILVHAWGSRTNRRKAAAWVNAYKPALRSEFASVGFAGRRGPSVDRVQQEGLAKAMAAEGAEDKTEVLREKSKDVFLSYATGRQNVAFVDVKLSLYKRYNPFALIGDFGLSFFMDSMPAPSERVEITAYAFDGKEGQLIPRIPTSAEPEKRGRESTYDGFVWAVVHKDEMKRLRDERYDLSLTTTKDHARLPAWATIMSESAEITETLLTPELVKAVEAAGEDLESLVVTDMPEDQPKTLNELVPKKRLNLNLRFRTPGAGSPPPSLPLFSYFLRMPDQLVSSAHFRPEVMRRVRATREEETKKIKKLTEAETAEERKTLADKAKFDARNAKLKTMSADQQRKFLEKEKEKNQRKSMGRKTMKA